MLLGYPIGELAWLAVLIAGAGIVVGILAGLFGIGGGAVIVPFCTKFPCCLRCRRTSAMQMCIGTSLAIIVPTRALPISLTEKRRGHSRSGPPLALPAVVGVDRAVAGLCGRRSCSSSPS